jgi:tetratricopeptide (TPR) repeat protein
MKHAYDIPADELELIEDYLRDEMSPAQSVWFKEKMSTDSDWFKKINEVKLVQTGITELSLQNRLDSFHDEIKSSPAKTSPVLRMITRWAVAASVLIIISVSFWLLTTGKDQEEKLYSRYFKPDPGLMTAMGSTDNYIFEKGMVEYKNEEYRKAIETWDTLFAKSPANDTLQYFMGAAQQASGNDEQAKKHLQVIASKNDSPFFHDACWYLGILLLKQKQTTEATRYIKQSNYPEAVKLLSDINQNK